MKGGVAGTKLATARYNGNKSMIVGNSLYVAARSETLSAAGGSAGGDAAAELRRRFGLSLGPGTLHAPSGAMVVAVEAAAAPSAAGNSTARAVAAAVPAGGVLTAGGVISVGDVISAVDGVGHTDVAAVQAALLRAAPGAVARVAVRSPASLESAYAVRGVLGKGNQGCVVRAVSKADGAEVAVKTLNTARPSFKGLSLSAAMVEELAAYQDELIRREVDLVCTRRLAPPEANPRP